MMFGKIDRYLLIAILAILLVCLYFLFVNKKDTNDQSNLLVAMAKKMNSDIPQSKVDDKNQYPDDQEEEIQQPQISEEEQQQVISIADKLCFGVELNEDEKKFHKAFPEEISNELKNSRDTLSIITDKFLKGENKFTEFEQEYYAANQEYIDEIIHTKRLISSVINKITTGNNDFTIEEMQVQKDYPAHIEQELARIQKEKDKFKGGNPPLAAGDRLKTILSFFEDGVPKTVTDLANLYAEKTGTKVNKGNISTIFGKLVKDHQLVCTKAGKDNKIYHGLPEWFNGSKLKPEYKQKIIS